MVHQYHVSKGKRIQVSRNVKEAYELDAKNGNTKWQDAMKEEIDALLMFITFIDHGKIPYLEGYKNIIVHFVFDVKHDLRHKARLVAGGHLTDPSTDGTYSGVVNLRTMRISITVGEMNGLSIMVGDVSSTYLEAYTQEKVCFIAGPEFGLLQGHLLVIIDRALYGLRTSGACWHDRYLMFYATWAISSVKQILTFGLRTVIPIMNMFWSMLMISCALVPTQNASSSLSQRHITSS